MKSVVLGLAAAVSLAAGAAQAQVPPKPPGAVECAAVYGAFGQDQDQFGATDSLVAERYPAFARIGFDDRLTALAGKAERGVSDLKAAAQDTQSDDYAQLVDAETEGDHERAAGDGHGAPVGRLRRPMGVRTLARRRLTGGGPRQAPRSGAPLEPARRPEVAG
ncbi:MAG: hypothetical protein WDM92_02255 [Caulobacteraceae bacterium]